MKIPGALGVGCQSQLPRGQEMFTACGFLSVSNLSLLRLSPTRPHPTQLDNTSSWGGAFGKGEGPPEAVD